MSAPIFPSTLQIPVDYTISKGHLSSIKDDDLTVSDAYGNVAYSIRGLLASSLSSSSCDRIKTLTDPDGNPLISAVHRDDKWQGFRGNSSEREDLMFTATKISGGQFKTDIEVFLTGADIADQRPSFRLMGSPFRRSCTIYNADSSIVAQTNPLYKLGKVIHSRRRFRLTVYPGIDHSLVIAMLITFFG